MCDRAASSDARALKRSAIESEREPSSLFSMNGHQNLAFQQLLSAWNQREEARSSDSIADLFSARASLDAARSHMNSTLHI